CCFEASPRAREGRTGFSRPRSAVASPTTYRGTDQGGRRGGIRVSEFLGRQLCAPRHLPGTNHRYGRQTMTTTTAGRTGVTIFTTPTDLDVAFTWHSYVSRLI